MRVYDLINPNKRLLDFWCGHPDQSIMAVTVEQEADCLKTQVYLHPQLKTERFRQEVLAATRLFPVNLKVYFSFLHQEIWLDRILLMALFAPLLEQACSLEFLVKRWLTIRPVDPVTLAPTSEADAFLAISQAVMDQERLGIILLDKA